MTEMPTQDRPAAAGTVTFDFAALTPRERYKLLIGAVVPRPIGCHPSMDLPLKSVTGLPQVGCPVRRSFGARVPDH